MTNDEVRELQELTRQVRQGMETSRRNAEALQRHADHLLGISGPDGAAEIAMEKSRQAREEESNAWRLGALLPKLEDAVARALAGFDVSVDVRELQP